MTSGYSKVEEMAILNHFRRNLNKGMDLEQAKNNLTGLDVWLVRHQSASGVKRFIESKFVDVALIMSKKKEKKMKPGHCELIKKAFRENPGAFDMIKKLDEPLKSPSLASLASTLSMSSHHVTGSVITTTTGSSKASLIVDYNLSRIDELIIKAAEKGIRNVDDIEKLQDSMETNLIHGIRVQEAFDEVMVDGKLTNDTSKLTQYLDVLEKEYNELTDKELKSLKRYQGEPIIDDIISEYSSSKLYTNNKKIQDDLFDLVNSKLDELQSLLEEGIDTSSIPDVFLQLAQETAGNKRKDIIEKNISDNPEEAYGAVLRELEENVVSHVVEDNGLYDITDDEIDPEGERELSDIKEDLEKLKKPESISTEEAEAFYKAFDLPDELKLQVLEEEDEDHEDIVNAIGMFETPILEIEETTEDKTAEDFPNVHEGDINWQYVDLDSPFLDFNEKQILMDGNCIDFATAAKKLRDQFPSEMNRTQNYTYLFALKRFRALFEVAETTRLRDDPKKYKHDVRNFKSLWQKIVGEKTIIVYEYESNIEKYKEAYNIKQLSEYTSKTPEPKKYKKVISKSLSKLKFDKHCIEVGKINDSRTKSRNEIQDKLTKLEEKLEDYKNREHKIQLFADIKINRLSNEIFETRNSLRYLENLPLGDKKDCLVYKYKIRNEWKNWQYVQSNGTLKAYKRGLIEPIFRPKYEDIDMNKTFTNQVYQTDYKTHFAILGDHGKIILRKKVRKGSENYVKFSKLRLNIGIETKEDMEEFLRRSLLKAQENCLRFRKLRMKQKALLLSTEKGTFYRSMKSMIAFGFITKRTCNLTKRYRLLLGSFFCHLFGSQLDNKHALPNWVECE